jgi:predicted nucleotidyltransferase
MYDNTGIRIIEQIYLSKEIHKRELARKLKLTMPSIENSLNKLKSIIKIKKVGNQLHLSLDYSKKEIVPYLSFVETRRFNNLPKEIQWTIDKFLVYLKAKPLITVLFGSYAKGNYNKNSDIDVLVVFQSVNEKDCENSAKRANMEFNTKLSPIYLNYEDFKDSYHQSNKEFFNKLKEDKIILNGLEWWRQIENESS